MPGNLQTETPHGVLPNSLAVLFTKVLEYWSMDNTYRDGSSQRSTDIDSPRSTWKLTRRLPPPLLEALATFYTDVQGPLLPFHFYDPFQPAPGQPIGSNYDPTGVSPQGQYTVRWEGAWKPSYAICRSNVPLTLVEVY
jgi:hypothetical protein